MHNKRFLQALAFAVLAATLAQANTAHAETASPPTPVLLDGRPLAFPLSPVIEDGNSLVPMRSIFEAQGAKVTWDNKTKTVSALKDGNLLTYRIGDTVAYKNALPLAVPYPGKTIEGFTMVPLRFVSETLGNAVKWHDYSHSITISTSHTFETTVEYGVNLRVAPGKDNGDGTVIRQLAKGDRIHVIRELGSDWLEVQTTNDDIAFMSAKPMYSDYSSPALVQTQGSALLSFGSQYLGTPYDFGAKSGNTESFDCSSFVQYVFKQVLSIDLPRVSYDQAKVGTEVAYDDLRVGDLMFFSARDLDIGHVGIYAGNGQILHTYSKEKGVHFMTLDDKWKKRFVTARRVF